MHNWVYYNHLLVCADICLVIISHIVVVWVNRVLSDGSVDWCDVSVSVSVSRLPFLTNKIHTILLICFVLCFWDASGLLP